MMNVARISAALVFGITSILLPSTTVIKAELFTALVDFKHLLRTEHGLISSLDKYIAAEVERLIQINKYTNAYKNMISEIEESDDVEKYLSNPVNAYLLIKRLTRDVENVQKLIKKNDPANKFINSVNGLKFPTEEDLEGTVAALLRLQDTYKLDTSVIASGQIHGVTSFEALNAGDCFELGRQSYLKNDHYHCVMWMQEAMVRHENEMNKTASRSDILEHLAYSTYLEGNTRLALKYTNELLEILPNHQRAHGNKLHYEHLLKEDRKSKRRGDDGISTDSGTHLKKPEKRDYLPEREKYEQLCRFADKLPAAREARLACRYFTNNHPYLLLQPAKQEDAFDEPGIYRYHDIISDHEINVVKELAIPRLKRATARNHQTGQFEPVNYRISKSGWLGRNEDPAINRIWSRIEAITNLNMDASEDLQVVNYGIGGQYEPHFDFARKEEKNAFSDLGKGNRVATVLFYLSDVEAGGATVFPTVGARLTPEKGSAVFWWNLKRSGEGDLLTRHAGCPVLSGSKWVANFWVHEVGQEFRRPCALDRRE